MITLLPFQIKSAEQIAKRYMEFQNSENRPYETRTRPTPFYQALSALTGAGKTPILADAVVQMRLAMPVEPLVLWISKAKAVIDQTYNNMKGCHENLIEKGFQILFYVFVPFFVWHFAIPPEKWFMWLLRFGVIVGSLMAIYGTITENYILRNYIGGFVLTGFFLNTCAWILIS